MMNAEPENPWLVDSMQSLSPGCMTCDAQDRLRYIRASADLAWLRKVVAYPHNQKTVQQAAERRLRRLEAACRA